jgi:DNA-binding GntR family transcriptional regulator
MKELVSGLAALAPLERATLGDRVYGDLKNLLMAGKLSPDEKLSLRMVADTLGVSVMPVREAVSRLVADGALIVLPNRSIRVPLMTRSKFVELTRIRMEIEGFAAQEAALHRTHRQLMGMIGYDESFRMIVQSPKGNVEDALQMNQRLHFSVYEASRMPSLVGLIEGLWLRIGPVFNLDLSASQRLATGGAQRHHKQLVEAVAGRSGEAAREALVGDIRESSDFILQSGSLPEADPREPQWTSG